MEQKDKDILDTIYRLLGKLYELNAHGYFTAWMDWSGHTNGIYIKIIKGKWTKGKKEKVVYESLVCTKFRLWKDTLSDETFDSSDFISFVQSLIENKSTVKNKRYCHEKAKTGRCP